jgi:predicted RNA-binding protein associated with RNAse of E/G family
MMMMMMMMDSNGNTEGYWIDVILSLLYKENYKCWRSKDFIMNKKKCNI